MKKIQVGTVPQTANVEVIFINSSFAIKVARVQCALTSIKNKIERVCMTEDVDNNGEKIMKYNGCAANLSVEETMDLHKTVIAFIDELTLALEGE